VTRATLSLADIVSLAAAVVAIGGAALGLCRGARKIYRRTVGSRQDLARRLNQLGAGVTARWVEERFGTPAFVRALQWHEGRRAGATIPARELVYREKHAWLQVIVNEHDAVLRFSVTVTDPRFRFSTWSLTNYQLKVRLGRSSFAAIGARVPAGRSLRIGAHTREYAEAYWGANPGNYQWFVLSHNDVGTGAFDHSIERPERGFFPPEGVLAPGGSPVASLEPFDQTFRAKTVINTLTVLGPLQDSVGLAEPRGPETNQVRVLLPGARQRWKIRWRIRRARRQAHQASMRQPEPLPDGVPGGGTCVVDHENRSFPGGGFG
jgi:hypothetical protein